MSAPPATSRASARRGSGCVQRRRPVTPTGRRPGPPPVGVYPRMCGGKRVRSRGDCGEETVYPRMCGGKGSSRAFKTPACGLSPHVRGKERVTIHFATDSRSIPACAGERLATAPAPAYLIGSAGFLSAPPTTSRACDRRRP